MDQSTIVDVAGWLVQFGDVRVRPLKRGRVSTPLNALPSAQAVFVVESASPGWPDYLADVVIGMETRDGFQQRFYGVTDSVRIEDGIVHVDFVNDPTLPETVIRGWSMIGLNPRELMWSSARIAGYDEERIRVQGFVKGPWEVFEVATSIDGLNVEGDQEVAGVTFVSGSALVPALAVGFDSSDIRSQYTDAPAHARTLVTAPTLFDAEQHGLARIDHALNWMVLRGQYSFAVLPGGRWRGYQRLQTVSRPQRRDVVAVRGMATHRRWLRAPTGIRTRPDLKVTNSVNWGMPVLPPTLTYQEREALATWRRASTSDDPIAVIGALWETIEFYTHDVPTQDLFNDESSMLVVHHATEGLSKEQARRVAQKLQALNRPAVHDVLDAAYTLDAVAISKKEKNLLRRVRELRNDYVHGRSKSLPKTGDVRYAVALVNRMLLHRVHRRSVEWLRLVDSHPPPGR